MKGHCKGSCKAARPKAIEPHPGESGIMHTLTLEARQSSAPRQTVLDFPKRWSPTHRWLRVSEWSFAGLDADQDGSLGDGETCEPHDLG